jgi:hypothetical protein
MIEINVRAIKYAVRTRAQRRAALSSIIKQLHRIRDAELECLCNSPANFSLSFNCHVGENAIEAIDCAIDSLDNAYYEAKHSVINRNMNFVPF